MIGKPFIEPVIDKKLPIKLPFYRSYLKEPNTKKYSNVFKNYERSYTVEILGLKDPEIQLNITEAICKNLLKDLLVEMKGPKYQITLQVTFCKETENDQTKYSSTICFSSNTQTVLKI